MQPSQNLTSQAADGRKNSATGSSSDGSLSGKQFKGPSENVTGGAFMNTLNKRAEEIKKNQNVMDIPEDFDVDGPEQAQGNHHGIDDSINSAQTHKTQDNSGRIGSYNTSVESKGSLFGQ